MGTKLLTTTEKANYDKSVFNIADRTALKAYKGTSGQTILQKDIDLKYEWVEPQITDNGVTVINVDGDTTGSWKAIYSGIIISPEWAGAIGDGVADDSDALQKAININGVISLSTFYFSSKEIVFPLVNGHATAIIYGSGREKSGIILGDNTDGFSDNGVQYTRLYLRDFSIKGGNLSGKGLNTTGLLYNTVISNVEIYTGDSAFYCENTFSIEFNSCHASSFLSHGFDIFGGNTVSLNNCYAHNIPDGKAGYRIKTMAVLNSCNGVDNESNCFWGIFGGNTDEDGTNSVYHIMLNGCNMEDFGDYACRFKYSGTVILNGGQSQAKSSGTYEATFLVDWSDKIIDVTTFRITTKGATRNKLADIYTPVSAQAVGCDVDASGTVYKGTILSTNYTYLKRKLSYSMLHIGELYFDSIESKAVFNSDVILNNLPTSDPGVVNQLWNDNGTPKISAG